MFVIHRGVRPPIQFYRHSKHFCRTYVAKNVICATELGRFGIRPMYTVLDSILRAPSTHARLRLGLSTSVFALHAPCEVMVERVRSMPAYAVDNFGVKGGCFIFPSNQNTHANLNFVLIKKNIAKMSHRSCCVVNCKNTSRKSECKFYKFPTFKWKINQRNKWVAAVYIC